MKDWKFDYVVYTIVNCELVGLWCNSVSTFADTGTGYSIEKISPQFLSWKVTGITSEKNHNYITLQFQYVC